MDAADYRICAYFRSRRGVYVNLYVPSTLRWKSAGASCSLRQTTAYPYSSHVGMEVTVSRPAEFSVYLRIPAWARRASLTVNGMRDSRKVEPGGFAEVRRTWKSGDRIELELPFGTRLEAVDAQHPDTVALSTGPLVLMAVKGTGNDPATKTWKRADLLAAAQTASEGREWTAANGALTLKPFAEIHDEGYTTYLNVERG